MNAQQKLITHVTTITTLFFSSAVTVFAANSVGGNMQRSAGGGSLDGITNPAISAALGGNPDRANSGATFSSYFITIWRALIVVGALAVLFNLVNGAIEWVTAGGDAGKVKHAREKMTQAIVGMILLAGSFAIVAFIGQIFGLNILKFTIPTPS